MKDSLTRAHQLYKQHLYTDALSLYRQILLSYPQSENLRLMIGNCLDALGDKLAAEESYREILTSNPDSVSALANLATICYEKGSYREARQFSLRVLELKPEDLSAFINLGNILYQQKEYEQALKYYQKAEKCKPDYYVAVINIANTYADLKNYSEAVSYAHKALKLRPGDVTSLTLLGNSYLELDQNEISVEYLLPAIEISPDDPWLYNSLSQAYQNLNQWQKAVAAGWSAVEKSGGEEAQQLNFGYLLYEAKLAGEDSLCLDSACRWRQKYDDPIVRHMAAAIENRTDSLRAEDGYVQQIFDVFADDFEAVLTGLDYQAPNLIRCLMEKFYGDGTQSKLRILDAGCGTGFCGEFLQKYAAEDCLYGVDISSKMLDVARQKKLYSHLLNSELEAFFASQKNKFDLITAADVFTYFGDLSLLFGGMKNSLEKNGRIIFTVSENRTNEKDYFLHASGRYLHHQNYLNQLLDSYAFETEIFDRVKLRNEGDKEVFGYLVSAVLK